MATIDELSVLIGAQINESGFRKGEAALAGIGVSAQQAAATASAALSQLGGVSEAVAGRYADAAGRLREANGRFVSSATLAAEAAANVGGSFAGVGAKAQGLASVINGPLAGAFAAFDKRVNELDKGIGRLGDGLKSAGTGLTAGVTLPLVGLGAAALVSAGDIEALEKGFAATYKGSEDLGTALAKVQTLAKLPGLGLKEAEQGATNLQAAGFSADLATRALGAFGNALATVGKGKADLDGVGLALSQIASKGKISAEEINQLAERVPQIRVAMQAAFGTADTEVLQKLGISANAFVEGVTAELEKLPKVSGGINNAFENIADSGTIALSKLGKSLNKTFDVEGTLGRLGDFVTALADKFEALDPATQKAIFVFAGLAAAAGPLLFAIGSIGVAIPAVTAGFATLGITSVAALAPVLGIAAGVAAAALLIYENWDRIAPLFADISLTLSGLGDSFRNTFGGVGDALTSMGLTTENLGKALKVVGSYVTDFLLFPFRLLAGALDVVIGQFRAMVGLLTNDFAGAGQGVTQVLDGIKLALFNIHKATPLKGSFAAAFEGVEEVSGLIGGDIAGSLAKVTRLTKEQQDALDKLRQSLRDNENASLALGDKYDFIGGKAKVLESGIKSLTDVGFAPAGRTVQGFVAQLNGIPEAVDRAVLRVAKGLEKLNETPEFKLKTPDKVDLPEFLTPVAAAITLPAVNITAYTDSLGFVNEAQRGALLAQEEFNINTQALIDQFPLDGFAAIGAGIGDALANGGNVLEGAGQALLKVLADFGIKYGQQLIALGIADIATGIFVTKGIGEIAAGTGLIAASSALGAIGGGAGGGRNAAGGGGGATNTPAPTRFTPSVAPNGVAQSGTTAITHNVQFVLSGNQLVGAIAIETDRLGRVRGR